MSEADKQRRALVHKLKHERPVPARHADLGEARSILLAASHDNKLTRRLSLRKAAMPHLKLWEPFIREAMQLSPLVGDGEKQVNIAKTPAAFRDALPNEVLMAIAYSSQWVARSLLAILMPQFEGMTASTSKTGFHFGRPHDLEAMMSERIKTQLHRICITAPTTGEEEMSTSAIQRIQNVYRVCLHNGYSRPLAVAAMAKAWEQLRDERPAAFGKLTEPAAIDKITNDTLGDFDLIPDGFFEKCDDATALRDRTRAVLEGLELHEKASEPEAKADTPLRVPGEHEAKIIDVVLQSQGLPPVRDMIGRINEAQAKIKELETEAKISGGMTLTMAAPVEMKAAGELPQGKVVTKKAWEAMGLSRGKGAFDFDVPVWEWEHAHPHVPEKDEDYIFRPFVLLRALYALVTNQKSWIYGHTGTGKSTLVEQICARLNWPMMRVNFDSEITRLDLVGREVLRQKDGVTVSHFEEGILPRAMQLPVVLLMDEMDYIRPDVSYVLQRVTEGSGLMLTEDGGRLVQPHPMFRIMATANTQGQGDEYGMYAGARQQSMAFLDRFTSWIEVEYLGDDERYDLLTKRVPDLDQERCRELVRYSAEHIEAFTQGKVMQPISPRGMVEAARAMAAFLGIVPKAQRKRAIEEALGSVLLDRATPQDRAVLKGIADRVFS